MEKRSRRRVRDLVTQPASQGLSENEIGCARISMMARSTNAPFTGRIQKRKTNHLHPSHSACNTRPVHTVGSPLGHSGLQQLSWTLVTKDKNPCRVFASLSAQRFAVCSFCALFGGEGVTQTVSAQPVGKPMQLPQPTSGKAETKRSVAKRAIKGHPAAKKPASTQAASKDIITRRHILVTVDHRRRERRGGHRFDRLVPDRAQRLSGHMGKSKSRSKIYLSRLNRNVGKPALSRVMPIP